MPAPWRLPCGHFPIVLASTQGWKWKEFRRVRFEGGRGGIATAVSVLGARLYRPDPFRSDSWGQCRCDPAHFICFVCRALWGRTTARFPGHEGNGTRRLRVLAPLHIRGGERPWNRGLPSVRSARICMPRWGRAGCRGRKGRDVRRCSGFSIWRRGAEPCNALRSRPDCCR